MSDFYDWQRTFSYDADVTMVVGARGVGKTFGLRLQFIEDYIRHGWRFVEVVRYKNELGDVSDGYFDKIQAVVDKYSEYVFKTDSRYAYIAKAPEEGEKVRDWKRMGYFVALSEGQKKKKKTFVNVRRILLDEAIIEASDRYHTYLPNEFATLANIVDTVSRERADTRTTKPCVYLLANACDLYNPYFAAYGVDANLTFGYRWYRDKTFLLHYVDAGEYASEKLTGTVAGRMLANTSAGGIAARNEFVGTTSDFVTSKPKHAKFAFAIRFSNMTYGVWVNERDGFYHVTDGAPRNTEDRTHYLTREDAQINMVAARRVSAVAHVIAESYYMGMLRYDKVATKAGFERILELFGVR